MNNCVSFTNYKYFVLFLGYSFGLCLYSAIVAFPFFLKFWKNDLANSFGKLHILFLFFVSIMFAVSLASLFFYHIFLTLKNRSTLESFRTPIFRYGPDKKAYDLGKKNNWKEIFGHSLAVMFLPISTKWVLLFLHFLLDRVSFPRCWTCIPGTWTMYKSSLFPCEFFMCLVVGVFSLHYSRASFL